MLGFKTFINAARTIAGIELVHRIRKGQPPAAFDLLPPCLGIGPYGRAPFRSGAKTADATGRCVSVYANSCASVHFGIFAVSVRL
jgi:hypothetical protein